MTSTVWLHFRMMLKRRIYGKTKIYMHVHTVTCRHTYIYHERILELLTANVSESCNHEWFLKFLSCIYCIFCGEQVLVLYLKEIVPCLIRVVWELWSQLLLLMSSGPRKTESQVFPCHPRVFLECVLSGQSPVSADPYTTAVQSRPFLPAHQGFDWQFLSPGNSLTPGSAASGSKEQRQLERDLLSSHSWVPVVFSRDWRSSLKGK